MRPSFGFVLFGLALLSFGVIQEFFTNSPTAGRALVLHSNDKVITLITTARSVSASTKSPEDPSPPVNHGTLEDRETWADAIVANLEKTGRYIANVSESNILRSSQRANNGSLCHAICLIGLPRTLAWSRVHKNMRKNLIEPLGSCVDVYWFIQLNAVGHRPELKGLEADTTFGTLRDAIGSTKPVQIVNTGGGWRSKFKQCWKAAEKMEADAFLSAGPLVRPHYDMIWRVRTDFLFYRPFDTNVLRLDSPSVSHSFENMMDFFQIVSRPKIKDPSKHSKHHVISLDSRICRMTGHAQRRLETFDFMWVNLLQLLPHRPRWTSTIPRVFHPSGYHEYPGHKIDATFKVMSVFCYRLDLLYAEQQKLPQSNGRACNATRTCFPDPSVEDCADGKHIQSWSYRNSHLNLKDVVVPAERCHLARSLVEAFDAPDGEGVIETIINYLYSSGERLVEKLTESENLPLHHVLHSCKDWKDNVSGQKAADFELLDYYSHSSLECNSNISEVAVRDRRRMYQMKSLNRLQKAFSRIEAMIVEERSSSNISNEKQTTISPYSLLFSEFSIFCEVYRQQLDFLKAKDSIDLELLHEEMIKLLQSVHQWSQNRNSNGNTTQPLLRPSLQAIEKHFPSLTRSINNGNGKMHKNLFLFRNICGEFELFDEFRCQAEHV